MAKQDDDAAMQALRPILAEYPDLTEQEILDLYQGIIMMGAIAYEKTQEGKIFITDEPTNTH